jgi:hypothetical protein
MAMILTGCVVALCCAAPRVAGTPQDASVSLSGAQHQFETGNYAGAISALQPLASQNSTNPDVYYWLGRNYYELRDYDNSIANLRRRSPSVLRVRSITTGSAAPTAARLMSTAAFRSRAK